MRKIYRKIFMTVFFACPLIKVYADNVFLECPEVVNPDSQFTCNLRGDSQENIKSITAKITTSKSLKYINFVASKMWEGNGANNSIDLYGGDAKGSFDIGTLYLQNIGNENNVLSLDSIIFYDDNYKEIGVNSISSNIIIKTNNNLDGKNDKKDNIDKLDTEIDNNINNKETDDDRIEEENSQNYLENILIRDYELDFVQGKRNYDLKINDDKSLIIIPVSSRKDLLFEIIGNDDLVDKSIIKINVLQNNEIVEEYKINIKKISEKKTEYNYNYIFIIIIGVLLLVNILRIILKRRKNEKNNS